MDLDLLIIHIDHLNFDKIEKIIDELKTILEIFHTKYHNEDLHELGDYFKEKIEIIRSLKSTSAVLNNSYRNILILRDLLFEEMKTIEEYKVINSSLNPLASSITINENINKVSTKELKKLYKNSHSDNLQLELLISHMEVYKKYFNDFIVLNKKNENLGLTNKISKVIDYFERYNKNIIENVEVEVLIFEILLIIFLVILYILTTKLDKNLSDMEELNENFNRHVIASETDLDGNITYASKAFSRISGYSNEELVGQTHNIIRHPDMSKEIFKDLWTTLKQDKIWVGDLKNLRKNGSYYWVHSTISPVFDTKGDKKGYSSIREDITDAKAIKELNDSLEDKIQKAIADTKKQELLLQQHARLAQMGEMISMIAHQWRQPISAINNILNDLELEIDLDELESIPSEEIYRYSKNIKEFTAHLSKTIDDFRNFYNPNKQAINGFIKEPINNALNIIEKSLLSDKIEIIKDFETEHEVYMFDSELTQVILNVFKNAQDNFKEKNIDKPKLGIKTITTDDSCIVEICDNGGGIPDNILPKIFDPYFSTKSEKNGTGLGLYMSKTIIEKHHKGKFNAENRDNGVCFTIALNYKM